MEPPSPNFILKRTGEAVTNLNFWQCASSCGNNQGVQYLLSGYSNQGGIDIWNLHTRRMEVHHPSGNGVVSVYGNNNGEIIVLDKDGNLQLLDCNDGRMTSKSRLLLSNIGFCKASSMTLTDGATVTAVPGDETSSISVWDLKLQKLLWRLIPPGQSKLGMVMCLQLFKSDADLNVLAGYEDGSVILWDVVREDVLHKIQLYEHQPVMCIDYDVVSKCGIAGSPSETITKFVLHVNENHVPEITSVKKRTMRNPGVADLKIRPDRKILSVGCWDNNVRIFSWKTLKPLAVLKYHNGTVQSLAFKHHSDSSEQILASGSADHKIAVWKIYNS